MKNWRKSIEANTKAVEVAAAMLAADAGQMFIVRYSSFVYTELGDAYKAVGDCTAAAAWWGRANAHFERLKTTNQLNGEARADYAKMPGRFQSCVAAPLLR